MHFLATYHNRIDKKGRISVPAPFRAVLGAQAFQGIVAYASLGNACIEACGMDRIAKMNAFIETLPPLSEERDALATVVFGESVQLGFDTEGRVMMPAHLLQFAGIDGEAVFVGKGEIFEIWEPKTYESYAKKAREMVLARRQSISGGRVQ
jgi:MraZ protein